MTPVSARRDPGGESPLTERGILCRSLSFSYGEKTALSDLQLSVSPGEILGLLGPNGAGKTTTIRILAGLLRPRSGAASLGGHDVVTSAREARRLTAYIPDKPHLHEKLTAWEYFDFIAGLWEIPDESKWRDRARRELERWRLTEAADNLLESYSQGMRQKLLLAAGAIHEPSIWILDEPMTGLDPKACLMLREFLREEADRGAAVLLSTHTLDLAERLCNRVAIIAEGKKIAEGTMAELRESRRAEHERLEEIFLRLTEEPPE